MQSPTVAQAWKIFNYQLQRTCRGRKVYIQGLTKAVHGSGMGSFANCFKERDLKTRVVEMEDGKFMVLMVAARNIALPNVQFFDSRTHYELSFKYGRRSVKGCDWQADKNNKQVSKDHIKDTKFIRPFLK